MPSIIERHKQAHAELHADLDALRDTLVSRNVLDAADLPTPPDRPRPRPKA